MVTNTSPIPIASPENDNASASLFDYFREAWKDLELEMRLRKEDIQHGYIETRGTVHQAYQGTGRVVKDTFRAVKGDLGEQIEELKADLTVQKKLMKQDVQEFLETTRIWRSQVKDRQKQQQQQQQQRQQQQQQQRQEDEEKSDHASDDDDNCKDAQKITIMADILDYEATLADPSFIAELNSLIESKMTSCSDLVEYYTQRPDLKEYTLTKELNRMKYILYTDGGQKLTRPKDMVEYARSHPEQDDILWRAANQSIFGDLITSLTCETGLVRPQLSTATFVNDINVTIDFGRDAPHITAECFVNVTIPGREGQRLHLAGVLVGVYFCPLASKMEARVLHISPSQPLTDEELDGAADNLCERYSH